MELIKTIANYSWVISNWKKIPGIACRRHLLSAVFMRELLPVVMIKVQLFNCLMGLKALLLTVILQKKMVKV